MIKKIQFIICSLALMTVKNNLKSDTYGNLIVSNCYQNVEIQSTSSSHQIGFLKSASGNKVHIKFSTTVYITHIAIYDIIHHPTGPVTYSPVTIYPYHETDYYSATDSIRITPILNDTTFGPVVPLDIAFVDPIFITTDKEKPCLPFSGFKLNFFSNLSSLCHYSLKIKLPPGTPPPGFPTYNNIGLTPNPGWSMPIHDYLNSAPETIPINSEYCDTTIPQQNLNVNKCFTFNLEITIDPCSASENDPDCPPLTFTQPITFCCWCERLVW